MNKEDFSVGDIFISKTNSKFSSLGEAQFIGIIINMNSAYPLSYIFTIKNAINTNGWKLNRCVEYSAWKKFPYFERF